MDHTEFMVLALQVGCLFMGSPFCGFPVEKTLAGERIALRAPTLVST